MGYGLGLIAKEIRLKNHYWKLKFFCDVGHGISL